ncbi:hypothetical protein [Veronia pacifica]|uniref:ASP external chaperone domain-containing protein n=1 Tax=Veronia pacifica TaxID=1080227 RepID=A0A1C3EJX6_9GAMM|nr:hypothetical protein [Veronia pacifica]ODA33530.1 hypothetical protein A8L45_09985 [Veronia pacifica]
MKKHTITAVAMVALMSGAANAQEKGLQELSNPSLELNVKSLEVNGNDYQKVIPQTLTSGEELKGLFKGDKLVESMFAKPLKVTGLIYATLSDSDNANEVATEYGLELVYSRKGNSVFRAPENADLLSVNENLRNDSRVKAVKIELNDNKYQSN